MVTEALQPGGARAAALRRRLAIVGAGWAGLAAAVEATRRGWAVTLFEMAPQCGGRAREVDVEGMPLDNGQHILIGAYRDTLALMRSVGVDPDTALLRLPLCLVDPDGVGLRLPPGPPLIAFARGVLAHRGWTAGERLALLAAASGWALARFRCDAGTSVAALTAALPAAIRRSLIEPLCVAALNTPAAEASGTVFLRVLRDALFSGRGSADLLLPRVSLGALLPAPAQDWLRAQGATLRVSQRVTRLGGTAGRWQVEDESFDAVVLAAGVHETARLVQDIAPAWAARSAGLRHEPIVTVYLHSEGTRLPAPMLTLAEGPDAPAQFVFDRGQLGNPAGLLAFVVSGAQPWVDRGSTATLQAVQRQAGQALAGHLRGTPRPLRVVTEKRATFRCTPGLQRPPAAIADGLFAAGDHVDGPYPATLEGAVRSGIAAVRALG